MIPPRLMAKALAKITGQVPRAVAQPSGDHLPLQNQLTVVTTHNRYFVVSRTQRRKGAPFSLSTFPFWEYSHRSRPEKFMKRALRAR